MTMTMPFLEMMKNFLWYEELMVMIFVFLVFFVDVMLFFVQVTLLIRECSEIFSVLIVRRFVASF